MGKFAVVDIGSNSVRLVVYENLKRTPYVAFNEKVLCGLGGEVTATGKMSPDAMDMALRTLKRFSILMKKMGISQYRAVATAAVRDALNGPDFIKDIRRYCELDVDVINGEEEGRLSGLGVICALPTAQGVVGDLGGGSLELIAIAEGRVHESTSLPIGPLRLMKDQNANSHRIIDDALKGLGWMSAEKNKRFYAVGGAWRALAKLHMAMTQYPLINLHHYAIPFKDMMELCEYVAGKTPEEIQTKHNFSSRRLKVLPLAALTLQKVLQKIKPTEIIISGYGLREGLVFESMAPDVRAQDPLLQSCREMAEMTGRFPEHGRRLKKWIDVLFPFVEPRTVARPFL